MAIQFTTDNVAPVLPVIHTIPVQITVVGIWRMGPRTTTKLSNLCHENDCEMSNLRFRKVSFAFYEVTFDITGSQFNLHESLREVARRF